MTPTEFDNALEDLILNSFSSQEEQSEAIKYFRGIDLGDLIEKVVSKYG